MDIKNVVLQNEKIKGFWSFVRKWESILKEEDINIFKLHDALGANWLTKPLQYHF